MPRDMRNLPPYKVDRFTFRPDVYIAYREASALPLRRADRIRAFQTITCDRCGVDKADPKRRTWEAKLVDVYKGFEGGKIRLPPPPADRPRQSEAEAARLGAAVPAEGAEPVAPAPKPAEALTAPSPFLVESAQGTPSPPAQPRPILEDAIARAKEMHPEPIPREREYPCSTCGGPRVHAIKLFAPNVPVSREALQKLVLQGDAGPVDVRISKALEQPSTRARLAIVCRFCGTTHVLTYQGGGRWVSEPYAEPLSHRIVRGFRDGHRKLREKRAARQA